MEELISTGIEQACLLAEGVVSSVAASGALSRRGALSGCLSMLGGLHGDGG